MLRTVAAGQQGLKTSSAALPAAAPRASITPAKTSSISSLPSPASGEAAARHCRRRLRPARATARPHQPSATDRCGQETCCALGCAHARCSVCVCRQKQAGAHRRRKRERTSSFAPAPPRSPSPAAPSAPAPFTKSSSSSSSSSDSTTLKATRRGLSAVPPGVAWAAAPPRLHRNRRTE